jgi:NAD-dependent dihydropyrimidine dehydrogenase PreA subunit
MSTADAGPPEFVWGPAIEAAACTDCGACLDFCQNGVYEKVDGRVVVAQRGACVPGCSHCATLCEAGALTFPSLGELRASRQKG